MKIYLAGAYAHRAAIAAQAAQLEADGLHTITHRWFDASVAGRDKRADSLFDEQGVRDCDVLVAVADDPAYQYRGVIFELGMAVALRKTVLLLLPERADSDIGKCVFVHSPNVQRVAAWADVLRILGVRGSAQGVGTDDIQGALACNESWTRVSADAVVGFAVKTAGWLGMDAPARAREHNEALRAFVVEWAAKAFWEQRGGGLGGGAKCECAECEPAPPSAPGDGSLRVGLAGALGSGKTTTARRIVATRGGVDITFAGPLYAIMHYAQKAFGLPRCKDREFLQYVGTNWARAIEADVWTRIARERIEAALARKHNVVVSDMRFGNEHALLASLGFRTVRLTRPLSAEEKAERVGSGSAAHASETACAGIAMEELANDATRDALLAEIDALFA